MYNGLINVYKEPGFTSFDVVAVLRKILKQKKIGHTGTLDPAAEGVLLVCLGNGTRLCDMLENKTKEYKCVMRLGVTTDTEDMTGTILSEMHVDVTEEDIKSAVAFFTGDIMQVPPMYSALKVEGKKLYELAREGVVIERKPRPVTIYKSEISEIKDNLVTFVVKCSKGTYIRSLCRDIGERLGCGACMQHLVRTEVSGFTINESLKLSDIQRICDNENLDDYIVPVKNVFSELEILNVKKDFAKLIDNGNPLFSDCFEELVVPADNKQYVINNTSGQFVGVYTYSEEKKRFNPWKMFPQN